MSGEFHEACGNYMSDVLRNVADDRPVTGEPIADSIRELYIALVPVEDYVANVQASDSSYGQLVYATAKAAPAIREAIKNLTKQLAVCENIVDVAIREHLRDAKTPENRG